MWTPRWLQNEEVFSFMGRKLESGLISRPPFHVCLDKPFVVKNEIFSVKIANFIVEMDSKCSITLGVARLCNSNHWKLPFQNFLLEFSQKTSRNLGANGLEFSLLLRLQQVKSHFFKINSLWWRKMLATFA